MSVELQPLEQVRRDLGADELWERSLARSRQRRLAGEMRRSLVSAALADLDGPGGLQVSSTRDLADPELWDISATLAHGKRLAAEPGLLPQARVAGATLVVAAVAAALPVPGGSAASRARSSGTTRVHVELLKLGSRGPGVTRVQRVLRIQADGIFGPQTRRAVRSFQKRHGLLVDGIVGPQTRKALFDRAPAQGRFIRAWWVVPVQRALGVPADGLYGPVSRAAVRKFQQREGLVVDGVVGPQTLGALGIRRPAGGSTGGGGGGGKVSAPTPSSRGARVASLATRYLGIPYRWGGSSPSTGFDCSGFVMYLYRQVAVSLPHNAAMQYGHGRAVSRGSLRSGDIVFFNGLGHNGIYLGGGRFIHSPNSGDVVKISRLSESWYSSRYVGARRI